MIFCSDPFPSLRDIMQAIALAWDKAISLDVFMREPRRACRAPLRWGFDPPLPTLYRLRFNADQCVEWKGDRHRAWLHDAMPSGQLARFIACSQALA